jgi:hypothetical protein
MSEPVHPDTWADKALLVVLGAVAVYSIALVVAGGVVDRALFETLGFGSPSDSSSGVDDHIRLLRGVLGAVILGWVVLITAIVRGPLRRRDPWSWRAVASSLGIWYVVDTGFSLAVAEWEHALFNVGFAVALGIPLVSIRNSIGR